MVATDDVSLKNTKNEILDAYYEVLQELKEAKKTSKQETKKEQEKQSTIKTESQNTADQIVTDLANVKLAITRSLEEFPKKLQETIAETEKTVADRLKFNPTSEVINKILY